MNRCQLIQESIDELSEIIYKCLSEDNYPEGMDSSEKYELMKNVQNQINILESEYETQVTTLSESEQIEMLQEVNIRRLDKKTQVQLRALMIAISMAKRNRDPLYDKYKRGVQLRKAYKQAILHKYWGKAYQQALAEINKR